MTEMGAAHFREQIDTCGALVVGRKLYDFTNAWGGRHPMDVPVVVLTHNPPGPDNDSFVFVTEGIEAAIAKARELAGDKYVGLNSGQIAEPGAPGQADRRGLDRPRPGPARRRHAVLLPVRRPGEARGPAVDRRRQGRHTPAVSRALRVIDSSARARASSEPGGAL